MTLSALTFARQAQIGRIHFTRVGSDIQYDLVPPDPASVLAKLAEGNDAGKVSTATTRPRRNSRRSGTSSPNCARARSTRPKAEAEPDKPRVHVPDGKICVPA